MELQKTGCTHIRRILKSLLQGDLVGSHNQATPGLFDGRRIFLGSVRNPWEWYSSLWAFGCDKKGGVYNTVLRVSKNPKSWRDTYSDSNDAGAFRNWLYMIHDETYMNDIGEDYADCTVSRVAGLMTFRYLRLFCTTPARLEVLNRLSSPYQIKNYEKESCFIDHFVRNETLEEDLFLGLSKTGVELTDETRTRVLMRPRSNVSSRNHGPGYYYDTDTSNLIAEREQLIIEKFGYAAPAS